MDVESKNGVSFSELLCVREQLVSTTPYCTGEPAFIVFIWPMTSTLND